MSILKDGVCVDIYVICMYVLCIYLVYSLYIPCICRPPAYPWDITILITGIYNGYSQYIPCICRPPQHIPWIYLVYTKWVCSVPFL